jgi:hypothetical protein
MSYPKPVVFIEARSISELEDRVNEMVAKGYVLSGSPQNVGNKSYFVTMYFDEQSEIASAKYDNFSKQKVDVTAKL